MNKRKIIAVLLCLCFAISFMMSGYSAAIAEEGASDNGTSATDTTAGGNSDSDTVDITAAPSGSDVDNDGAPDTDTPSDTDNTANQPPVTPDNDNPPSAGDTTDPADGDNKPAVDNPDPTEPTVPDSDENKGGNKDTNQDTNKDEAGGNQTQSEPTNSTEQTDSQQAELDLARAQAFINLINNLPAEKINAFLTADETDRDAVSHELCAALDEFLGEFEKVDVGVAFESFSQNNAYLYLRSVTADIAKLQALLAHYAPADELAESYTAAVETFDALNEKLSAFMPVEPEQTPFDAESFYSTLLAMDDESIAQAIAKLTPQQVIDLFAVMNEEDAKRVYDLMSEEQIAEVEKYYAELQQQEDEVEEEFEPIVNFTDVAPFVVAEKQPMRFKALKTIGTRAASDGIETDKNVTVNDDGTYTIRLDTYANGTITTTTGYKPVDIVLVLDVSGSMKETYSYDKVYNLDKSKTYYVGEKHTVVTWCDKCKAWTDGCREGLFVHHQGTKYTPKTSANSSGTQFYIKISRLDALKVAVDGFIDSVAEKSPDNRIAIVKFAGDKTNKIGNDTYREGGYTYNYSQIVMELTKTDAAGTAALQSSINSLSHGGATSADYGMQHAETVLANADETHNKVVIMFADGEPNHSSGFSGTVANGAIVASKSLKDGGATVYTIGVFSGADGTPIPEENWKKASDTNKYMHLVSSNFKNATGWNKGKWPGSDTYPADGKSFFLSPENPDDLNAIFQEISSQTGSSSIELGSDTVVQDAMSPYFTIPEGAVIKVYSADCNGKTDDEFTFDEANRTDITNQVTVERSPDGSKVTVTGFDFSANYVAKDTATGNVRGKKQIIEFTVKPKDGFLGGNNVPTNDVVNSGVYKDNECLENYITPTANVPITEDIQITVVDKNIYLNGSLTAEQLKEGLTATAAGNDLTSAIGWQADFVDITFADSTGTFENMLDDATYTAKVTIAPKPEYDGAGAEGEAAVAVSKESDAAKINVFKPTFTFKDSEVYYGETTPADFADNLTATAWKHGETLDTAVTMTGTAPTAFAFTYDKANTSVSEPVDIPVSVTEVTLDGVSVKEHASYAHQDCAGAAAGDGLAAGQHFWLHVKTCTLTITKAGCAASETAAADTQSFVFTVNGGNIAKSFTVDVQGNGSVTIGKLPVGNYTVTEDKNWSWRYRANNDSAALSAENPDGTVTMSNSRHSDKWLNGGSYEINNFN